MRSLARILILAGMLAAATGMSSCLYAAYIVTRKGSLSQSTPLIIGELKTIEKVQLRAGVDAALGFYAKYSTDAYGRPPGRTEKTILFDFPGRYEVFDDTGALLKTGVLNVSSNSRGLNFGSSSFVSGRAPSSGLGELEVISDLFRPQGSGVVTIRAVLGPDEQYGAKAIAAELHVYDSFRDSRPWTAASVLLLFGGGGVVAIGCLLLLFARETNSRKG